MQENTNSKETVTEKVKDVSIDTQSLIDVYIHIPLDLFYTSVNVYVGDRDGLLKATDQFYSETFPDNKSMQYDITNALLKRIVASKYDCARISGEYLGVTTENNRFIGFVRMSQFSPGNLDDISILAHEILHSALGAINYVGINEGPGSRNEALCYVYEHIFKIAMKELHKKCIVTL